jgi:hypothetical protein
MAAARGIQAHEFYKLGKGAVRKDARNLQLAAILKAKPKLPTRYDFDTSHKAVPTPMFANDHYGDCVIAGRAHQTLRFELVEQSRILPISDKDVLREYVKETGGPDTGLVVLDSLNEWRHQGWKAAGKGYKITAYAQIDPKQQSEIKRAIFMDLGVGIGLSLPLSAQKQVEAGQPWDVVSGPGSAKGSWGGHYVYCSGYTPQGPVCVTWGRKQQMTWRFLAKYSDEAYAIIDAKDNTAKKRQGLNLARLDEFLDSIGTRRTGRKATRRV